LEVQAVYHENKGKILQQYNVKYVLLCGSECLRVIKGDMGKMDVEKNLPDILAN